MKRKLFFIICVFFISCSNEVGELKTGLENCNSEKEELAQQVRELEEKVIELENELEDCQSDLRRCKRDIDDLEFDNLLQE